MNTTIAVRLAWVATLAGLAGGCTLEPGPDEANRLPSYEVVAAGASAEQAEALAAALDVNAERVTVEDAIVDFLDAERFARVPMGVSSAEASPDEEQGFDVTRAAIDFGALDALDAPEPDAARQQFAGALEESGLAELFPQGGATPTAQRTMFEWQEVGAANPNAVALDARVAYELALGEDRIPLLGPGATVYATFDADGPTSLRFALRGLAEGAAVPVISADEAEQRCRDALGRTHADVQVETRTVYYAPPLEQSDVATILPHVECSGTAMVGEEEVALLQRLLPMVDDAAFVPEAEIEIQSEGGDVRATLTVDGGRAPYTVAWSSAHVDLADPPTSPRDPLVYVFESRSGATEETLTAVVTDANGIEVQAQATFAAEPQALSRLVTPQVGGITDYGTENAVTNEFGALESGFLAQMDADGATRRFRWTGTNAWEQDFKSPGDSTYIDNTDITFYVGHGYGGGFTFEDTTHDDDRVTDTDAEGDWGDRDLEWLALYSCQVLRDEFGGESYAERWLGEFDGLHLLLGFHTNAYVRQSFSGKFASNLVDHDMTVRSAWLKASDDTQPAGVVTRVMGVFGADASSLYDHFWGHGSVSPDLRGSDLQGWWSVTRTVD